MTTTLAELQEELREIDQEFRRIGQMDDRDDQIALMIELKVRSEKNLRRWQELDRGLTKGPAPVSKKVPAAPVRAAPPVRAPSLDEVDVRLIRQRLGLTQGEFALRFGFTVGTVRNWEQGRRRPDGADRVLLTLIGRAPGEVLRILRLN